MKKFMIYTIKGGEGKSTHSKTIARGFAAKGNKVLLVDVDPQGNSSKCLMVLPNDINYLTKTVEKTNEGYSQDKELSFVELYSSQKNGKSLSDVFEEPKNVKECIYPSKFENLDILPSNLSLAKTDTLLRLETNRRQENRIKKALSVVKSDYDVVVLDCPPIKSLLTVNALMCEPIVLIPVAFSEDALQGAALTIKELNALKEEFDEMENVDYRIILTMRQARYKAHQKMEELLRAYFGEKVLKTVIRYQESPLNEANSLGVTVLDLGKTKIKNDYEELLNELEEL